MCSAQLAVECAGPPGRYGAIYNFFRDYCRPAVGGRQWCDVGNRLGTESDSMGEVFALGNNDLAF